MHFTFIKQSPNNLPNLKINKDENDNLTTANIGVTESNAYFTSGDFVLNYNRESGEIVSFDGYFPYFEALPTNQALKLPTEAISGKLFVGDLTEEFIFAIDKLPLELSKDKRIMHAGENKSDEIIEMSKSVYIGLRDRMINDIYLYLDK